MPRARKSPAGRKVALAIAQSHAEERATLFRVPRRTRTGELLTGHRLHRVTGERHRRNLLDKGATPVLRSSEWRAIYQEVGL